MAMAMAPSDAGEMATRQRRRKKRSGNRVGVSFEEGWQKIDMEDMEVEGFQDGCAFELEELTDYKLQKTDDGGQILIYNKETGADANENDELQPEPVTLSDQAAPATSQKKKKRKKSKKNAPDTSADAPEPPSETAAATSAAAPAKPIKPAAVPKVKLPKWDKFKLHPLLRHSLHTSGFFLPTPIQEHTIYPALIDNRDIVGAAPTGSGKTLAFGLPILSQLLFESEQPGYKKECRALILTPTRELALQIQQHLERMVPNRELGIVTLVGGMALQKQLRLLTYKPEIVIGTPGRMWDVIDSKNAHFAALHDTLRFLVVDEADRVMQPGAYAQVAKIFQALRQNRRVASGGDEKDPQDPLTALGKRRRGDDSEEEEDEEDADSEGDDVMAGEAKVIMLDDILRQHAEANQQQDDEEQEEEEDDEPTSASAPKRPLRQTFLFSATLMIPDAGRAQSRRGKSSSKSRDAINMLENVMQRVGLRGKPAVVDLSVAATSTASSSTNEAASSSKPRDNVVQSLPSGLELCQQEVTDQNRDGYLYYFLTQYPGKTIVFLNAIHQVRKLAGLLTLLRLHVVPLHAEMQQRQRLKKLDAFRADPRGILLATDVAARGLDIPQVDYVVHYHIARSTEVFVHRSGRTARANKEGLSLSLVAPADAANHAQICKMLQRPTGLAEFPFDHRFLPVLQERLRLATAINDHDDAAGKVKSEASWFQQMADAADLEIDDRLVNQLRSKKNSVKTPQATSVDSMRAQLARLVAEPLRPVGATRKFRRLNEDLRTELTEDGEYRKRNAGDDLAQHGKHAYKRMRRKH